MITAFIDIRIIDLIDILLVAFIMYQLYYLIKGTVAFNIFLGISLVLILYIVVNMLTQELDLACQLISSQSVSGRSIFNYISLP